MLCGLRQGSPEDGILFAAWIAWKLEVLSHSWKAQGLGIILGRANGHLEPFWTWKLKYFEHVLNVDVENIFIAALSFADDVIFVAHRTSDIEIMLKEFSCELRIANLE